MDSDQASDASTVSVGSVQMVDGGYLCKAPHCNRTFKTKEGVKVHLRLTHKFWPERDPDSPPAIHTCKHPGCGKTYGAAKSANRHYKNVHDRKLSWNEISEIMRYVTAFAQGCLSENPNEPTPYTCICKVSNTAKPSTTEQHLCDLTKDQADEHKWILADIRVSPDEYSLWTAFDTSPLHGVLGGSSDHTDDSGIDDFWDDVDGVSSSSFQTGTTGTTDSSEQPEEDLGSLMSACDTMILRVGEELETFLRSKLYDPCQVGSLSDWYDDIFTPRSSLGEVSRWRYRINMLVNRAYELESFLESKGVDRWHVGQLGGWRGMLAGAGFNWVELEAGEEQANAVVIS